MKYTIFRRSIKAKEQLGWQPETSFDELVKIMVDNDLELAKKEKVLIENGLLSPTWESSN